MIGAGPRLYPFVDPDVIVNMVAFVAVVLKRMRELWNIVVHDGITIDAEKMKSLGWKMDTDLREERAGARFETLDQATWSGTESKGARTSYLVPNQTKWAAPHTMQ